MELAQCLRPVENVLERVNPLLHAFPENINKNDNYTYRKNCYDDKPVFYEQDHNRGYYAWFFNWFCNDIYRQKLITFIIEFN